MTIFKQEILRQLLQKMIEARAARNSVVVTVARADRSLRGAMDTESAARAAFVSAVQQADLFEHGFVFVDQAGKRTFATVDTDAHVHIMDVTEEVRFTDLDE